MEDKVNIFQMVNTQEIYDNMLKAEKYQDLEQVLVEMQVMENIGEEEARENARACTAAVSGCIRIREQLEQDHYGTVNYLLAQIALEEDRELILHELIFGLTAHQNEELSRLITGGVPYADVFWNTYLNQHYGHKTMEELEQEVYDAVARYDLSASAMEAFAKELETKEDYLVTAMALGDGNMNFKCILTMQAYLNAKGELTMLEAANKACHDAEVQAVADGLGSGMIPRSTAKRILIWAGIAVVVIAVIAVLVETGQIAGLMEAANTMKVTAAATPEIFQQFVAGNLASAEAKVKTAKLIRNIARVAILGGAGLIKLSPKFADCIGRFRVGFTANHQYAVDGMGDLRQEEEEIICEQVPAYEYIPVCEEQVEVQKATAFA